MSVFLISNNNIIISSKVIDFNYYNLGMILIYILSMILKFCHFTFAK